MSSATTTNDFKCGEEFCGATTIAYARVGPNNSWTRNTKQVVNGVTLGPAIAMVIGQYSDDSGYYLFGVYDDDMGTDTYHDDLEEAIEQMDHEYKKLSEEIIWIAKPDDFLTPKD